VNLESGGFYCSAVMLLAATCFLFMLRDHVNFKTAAKAVGPGVTRNYLKMSDIFSPRKKRIGAT